MKITTTLAAIFFLFGPITLEARILSQNQLKNAVNYSKKTDREIDALVKQLVSVCGEYRSLAQSIQQTVDSRVPRVTAFRLTQTQLTSELAPRKTALDNARNEIARKISLVEGLVIRLRNFGRPSTEERELKAEQGTKASELNAKRRDLAILRESFDRWEDEGNNSRTLDSAHDKLQRNQGSTLTPAERAALDYEGRFSNSENTLIEIIARLEARIRDINQTLATINQAETRTVQQLTKEKEEAIAEVRRLEMVRDREAESVNDLKKRIRQVTSQIAMLTGVAAAPPIDSACTPFLSQAQ